MRSKDLFATVFLLGFLALAPFGQAQENSTPPLNQLILEEIRSMPGGGGYSIGSSANQGLSHAARTDGDTLEVNASHATPSYCSGATYLVFLKTIAALQNRHQITLPPSALESLRIHGQPDGAGIWGRWNANGPGTARLFAELGIGHNFTDLSQARPGDFLKIWWSDSIGGSEHGHSVIFMGRGTQDGIPYLSYWSSNVPGGYGVRSVPMTRIHRMLFSRLTAPQSLDHSTSLPTTDHYLSSLQSRSSTPEEMDRECDVR